MRLPWVYNQWKIFRKRETLSITPWFRTWFLPFYLYALAQK